jgi:hydroxymethylbilane synthase
MLLRIGTRGSRLALAQSRWVKEKIEAKYSAARVELVRIKTKGDKILGSPLSKIGGKGLFVKEIEEALLRKEVDLAVHSMKDVPAELPAGLEISLFPMREDPRDAFVSTAYESIQDLPKGASVGTGSLRRSAQLLRLRPDLRVVPVRGNVDTRLKKIDSGDLHAVILASAGLRRLGLERRMSQVLSTEMFLPAIGQGVLGLEMRRADGSLRNLLRFLNHQETELIVRAERSFLKELEGGCEVPIAGYGRLDGDKLLLEGMIANLNASKLIRDEAFGPMERPEEIGVQLARKLLASGADKILQQIHARR